jgi:glycosyltransferase involved in cell wall biosynthesis
LCKGFDVIHYHNISLVGGPGILKYGEGIKLYTMHEYWLVCPTHMLFRYNREVCRSPHCAVCELSYKRPPQLWRHFGVLQKHLRHVDAFIAPSRFTRDIHQRSGLHIPIVHIPNFVTSRPAADVEKFDAGQPRTKDYFLFVGRLEKLKGLQTLLPVFRRFRKADLWIAGSGTYEPELRRLAADMPNVRFLGQKNEGELQVLYRRAIAVIVPSVAYECSPLVTLESFRQRTPVVVRNLGGMPEPIHESGGGFIYDTDEALFDAMDELASNRSRRNELGLRGYEAFKTNWTTEAHLGRYFDLIEEIRRSRRNATDSESAERREAVRVGRY